jgi:hypothetical protein
LIPATVIFGALLGVGLMLGAIFSHLLVIGIVSNADGGLLFMLAFVVLLSCITVLLLHKSQLLKMKDQILKIK